jgi:hypothetical protein
VHPLITFFTALRVLRVNLLLHRTCEHGRAEIVTHYKAENYELSSSNNGTPLDNFNRSMMNNLPKQQQAAGGASTAKKGRRKSF